MKLSALLIRLSIYVLLAAIFIPLGRRLIQPGKVNQRALVVYCAAGLQKPVQALARRYESEYGRPVALQFGGSGTLLANIAIAGRGDLYIPADNSWIEDARAKGLVAEVLPMVKQRPVIMVAKGNPSGIVSLDDLCKNTVRVSAGSPVASSIGRITERVMRDVGLWEALKTAVEARGVFKPTVPEVANDLKLGAVDASIVWDATAYQYTDVEVIRVPEFDAFVQNVSVAVLTGSASAPDALRFARFLSSRRGDAVFVEHRYEIVTGDAWSLQPDLSFFCCASNRPTVAPIVSAFEAREGVRVNARYDECDSLLAGLLAIAGGQEEGEGPDVYMACNRGALTNVLEGGDTTFTTVHGAMAEPFLYIATRSDDALLGGRLTDALLGSGPAREGVR